MAAASPPTRPPQPRFTGLAIALLLPVGILAFLAAIALSRDWRAARAEAAARARELVEATLQGAALRLSPVAAEPAPTRASPTGRGADGWLIGPSNLLLHPATLPWPPSPDPIAPESLPEASHESWAAAREATDQGRWAEALGHHDAFLAAIPAPPPAPPDTPSPAILRAGAISRLERANTLSHLGRKADAARALEYLLTDPHTASSTSEAGVPIQHLAALRLVELDPEAALRFATARDRKGNHPVPELGSSPATPFLDAFTEHIRSLGTRLPAPPPARSTGEPGLNLFEILEDSARCRRHHAAALRRFGSGTPWPDAFWIPGEVPGWLALRHAPPTIESTGGGIPTLGYTLVPEASLDEAIQSAVRELDRRGEFSISLEIAGRRLPDRGRTGTSPAASVDAGLAAATRSLGTGVGITASASLADPGAYYAAQKRRLLVFGGLVAAALFAALLSVHATRRSLLRQHELNLQRTNFVSSVSHELRAPLGSIRLLAEGLERGTVADESRRREYFQLIAQETRRLGSLVENVLDFSRIEQGRKRYEFEPTDLAALVTGTLRVFEPLASARGVTVESRLPDPTTSAEFETDGRALQQALLNLLDNALKHSPAQSRILVTLALPAAGAAPAPAQAPGALPAGVRLSVQDDGPGIPTSDHQRIFEPFYRRGSELRRETQGIGIGLSIVRHIVEAHRGSVEVDSSPGAGARFTLTLPAPAPPPTPTPNPFPS